MYIPRTLQNCLLRVSQQFPALLLSGPRQVGKTTLLKRICSPERTYVTLDDPIILSLAKTDPALFFQRYQPPLLIDEIQYAPNLFPYIKMQIDRIRKPGMFWLTGSQQFSMMKEIAESLAGRVGIISLLGLSRQEVLGKGLNSGPFLPTTSLLNQKYQEASKLELAELYSIIWRGSYPALIADPQMDKDIFYSSYIQTYLQRDLRDLTKVGDEMIFLRFLRCIAARTGQIINHVDLARDTNIAPNTAKSWLSILQITGIVYILESYHNNFTKRLIKAPKLYFSDTGLCSYLAGWSSPSTLETGAMSGAILETWILGEILKSYLHNGIQPPLFFYRDKERREIDLLIITNGTVYPLEIKKSATPNKNDLKNFSVLENLNVKIGEGGLICLSEHYLPLSPNMSSIPVGLL